MKVFKIICSIVLIITTIVLLIVSFVTKSQTVKNAFEISATVSLSLSITFSLTLNISNSFNRTYIYNRNNEDLDSAWKVCHRINAKISIMIGIFEQKGLYEGNKELDLNKLLKEINDLLVEGKEHICIYDGSKDITIFIKPKIDFIKDYLNTVSVLNDYSPIRLMNTISTNKKNQEVISLLTLLKSKYEFFLNKQEEK